MFCPNCGTQNGDGAAACTQCGFQLRMNAAPKFKGTMLMMNQPPGVPAAPVAPVAPPVAPPPAPAQPPPAPMQPVPGMQPMSQQNRLKGTMVGVAPPQMAAMVAAAAAAQQQQQGGAPPPAGYGQPTPALDPVNPLGGTFASDVQPPMPAGGYGSQGYGAPAVPPVQAYGSPYAPPPQAPSPYAPQPTHEPPPQFGQPPAALPPAGYGPPGGFGQAPGYGAPPGYGPPAGSYGAGPGFGQSPPHGSVPPAFQDAANQALGVLHSVTSGGDAPQTRNALMTILLPVALWTVVPGVLNFVAGLLHLWFIYRIAWFCPLAGWGLYWLLMFQMTKELRSVSNSLNLPSWVPFVPVYNGIALRPEVERAKQLTGARNAVREPIIYILLAPFALASDLNDIVEVRSR